MTDDRAKSPANHLDPDLLGEVAELVRSIEEGDGNPEDLGAYDLIAAENRVCHYVRTGELDQVLGMDIPSVSAPITSVSPVLHLKNLLVALNAICLHAAIDGGVSMRVAYGLNRRLSERIMSSATEEELRGLMGSRIIPVAYCMLVRELTFPGVADKDVIKAIRFIHDRHHERISVRDIAEHVGLTPEHLSAKFKRETGITVSAYIAEKRAEEAKALLRFSNLSIGEIAAQLAYSSQSYFQTAFKRVTGMTPLQYRQSSGASGGTRP